MSRITVCLDCPEYKTGGYCRHKKKDVGGLAPACDHALTLNEKFNPDNEEAVLEQATPEPKHTKTCARCKQELPRSAFYAKMEAKDGLESYCIECKRADSRERLARKRAAEGKAPAPEAYKPIETKRCPHCGRDLPISEYYMKDGKPNWICKECTKAYNVMMAKKKRDAKSAQENAGATTKVCKECGRELPLDAFGGHAKTWDHKATVCKECMIKKLTKNKEKGKNGSECVRIILDEGLQTVKTPPAAEPILLADIDTGLSLENVESRRLVEELRARGYTVTCQRPITVIEEI